MGDRQLWGRSGRLSVPASEKSNFVICGADQLSFIAGSKVPVSAGHSSLMNATTTTFESVCQGLPNPYCLKMAWAGGSKRARAKAAAAGLAALLTVKA